jgi:hypothetical protein
MSIQTTGKTLIDPSRKNPASIAPYLQKIRTAKFPEAHIVSDCIADTRSAVDELYNILRSQAPSIEELIVVDSSGKMIVWAGDRVVRGVSYSGLWASDAWFGGDGPDTAPVIIDDGAVTIGQNGYISIRDMLGQERGFLGVKKEAAKNITGATDNGSGRIRITVNAHGYRTGDTVLIENVGGVPNANGDWVITVVTDNTFDLDGSSFAGAYTGGGTATRFFGIIWAELAFIGPSGPESAPFFCNGSEVIIGQNGSVSIRDVLGVERGWLGIEDEATKTVTGAVNNGAGLIRLTVTGHGYITGDTVIVDGVGGVPNADGDWIITVIDANTFDLRGSTFAGSFTGGGAVYRYYAGLLTETIAIGSSFANYKLRQFRDGSMHIQDALITLTDGDNEITLDPSVPNITVANSVSLWQVRLEQGQIFVEDNNATGHTVSITPNEILMSDDDVTNVIQLLTTGNNGRVIVQNDAASESVDIFGSNGSIAATGDITADTFDASVGFEVGGITVINSSRAGTLTSVTLTTPLAITSGGTGASTAAGARTNLDVYSKSEVDALLAGKANVVHGHTMSSAGSHDHGGAVPADGGHTHTIS